MTKSGYNWYISVYGQYIKTTTDILDYLCHVNDHENFWHLQLLAKRKLYIFLKYVAFNLALSTVFNVSIHDIKLLIDTSSTCDASI